MPPCCPQDCIVDEHLAFDLGSHDAVSLRDGQLLLQVYNSNNFLRNLKFRDELLGQCYVNLLHVTSGLGFWA